MYRILLCCALVFSGSLFAADVRWDCFEMYAQGGTGHLEYYNATERLWVDAHFQYTTAGTLTTVLSDAFVCEFVGNWLEKPMGTTIDESTTRNQGSYFGSSQMDEDGISIKSLEVGRGETRYLAFTAAIIKDDFSGIDYFCYGWVGITVDAWGNPMLTGSAFDMDGGPMIVGGGSSVGAIPEPSGCLLMVMGIAALGLRRAQRKTGEE